MPDIAMCVGVKYYPWPQDFSEEAKTQGVSKAISRKIIPYIDAGETRLVLIHPRAIVGVMAENMSLVDLGLELVNEYVNGTDLEPPSENKAKMVAAWITSPEADEDDWMLAYVLDKLVNIPEVVNKLRMCSLLREADEAKELKRLEEKYKIQYSLGFFGYTYISGVQYAARDNEEELPDELKGKGIEAVRVVYGD